MYFMKEIINIHSLLKLLGGREVTNDVLVNNAYIQYALLRGKEFVSPLKRMETSK